MLGCFIDRGVLTAGGTGGVDASRRDELTGLLNRHGLRDQARAFQDEYYLRNTDFMSLHVSPDNLSSINRQYSFDFGDKVITALGLQLKEAFGTKSAVGRINGHEFVVIRQLRSEDELTEIRAIVRQVSGRIQEIDGIHITLYLSLGYSRFSETRDLELMEQNAEMRLLVDHDAHAPVEHRKSGSSDFFRLYDHLPIAYAVYKVHPDEERKVKDAEIFYANHLFEKRAGRPVSSMLGRSVRELFPMLDEKWFDIVGRCAMQGETIIENLYFEQTGLHYYMTASQIIRPGFCSITYQEIDASGKPIEPPLAAL